MYEQVISFDASILKPVLLYWQEESRNIPLPFWRRQTQITTTTTTKTKVDPPAIKTIFKSKLDCSVGDEEFTEINWMSL